MKGKITVLALAWTGIVGWTFGEGLGGGPLATVYSARMFDPDAKAWTAAQASDGRLYFGTNSVLEFDGTHWKNHGVGAANLVRALAFDRRGRLWVGAFNELGYFERTRAGLGEFVSLLPQLPPAFRQFGDIWNVFAQGTGAVFVAKHHVLRWDGTKFEIWEYAGDIRLVAFETAGTVYFHHLPTGLFALRANGPEIVIPQSVLGGKMVMWMESDANGPLLGTTSGFFHYRNGQLEPFAPELAPFIKKNWLTSVVRLKTGELAVGTRDGGIRVVRADGRLAQALDRESGLLSQSVNSLFRDRSGDLWALTNLHIVRLAMGTNTTLFDRQNGFTGQDCIALARWDGRLAIATENGLFASETNGDFNASRFAAVPHMPERYWDVQATGFGLLAAGETSLVLESGSGGKVLRKSNKAIFSIVPSLQNPGSYYVQELGDLLLLRRTDAGAFSFNSVARLPDMARGISEAPDGSLWIGTLSSGVLGLRPARDPASLASVTRVQGLSDTSGATHTCRVGSQVVVLTQHEGFLAGSDFSVRPLPALAGLKYAAVSKTAADGSVWFAASRIDAGERASSLLVRLSPRADRQIGVEYLECEGLPRIGAVRSLLFDDRAPATLWIGGSDGLLKVDVTRLTVPLAPRPPLLTAVQARREDGTTIPFAPEIPFAANRLTFTFSSTEYSRVEALRFQTRLLGIDREWAPLAGASPQEYLSLREGDYRFQVRAVSPAGLASAPAEWRFTVLPPWYRTLPVYAGYAVLAGLMVFGGAQLRLRTIRRRNRELERLVRERTVQLEQANAAKTQFVARINHDIRNPINGVLGLSLALGDTSLSPRQRKLAASLQQCARFLASLVDEVLDFAQLESSRDAPLKVEPFDLAGALTAAHATAQAQADELGCRIAVDLDPKLPIRVVGDAVRLQRIVVNFLINAVKYGGGPTVELSARVQQLDEQRAVMRVSVRDFGPGISDEEQRHLFNHFFRGRHAREQRIKGSGLGLAVCRLLAESMGGSVSVESAVGHGSLFSVTLPLALDRTPLAAPPTPPLVPIRVLVVEDEEYNAIATTAILRRLGYSVALARDGREALSLLRAHRFDVAFLDWDLPLLNGGEVACQYRRDEPADRHTLLIATTAFATEEQRQACFAAGMDGFVAKPLTPERITAALRDNRDAIQAAPSIHVDAAAAASAPAPTHEDFDLALMQLVADGSPAELARRLRELVDNCEGELRYVRRAIDAGDCAAARNAAHRLLNQARFIGADRFAGRITALQDAATVADKPLLADLLTAAEAEFGRLSSKLAAVPASPESGPPPTPAQNE